MDYLHRSLWLFLGWASVDMFFEDILKKSNKNFPFYQKKWVVWIDNTTYFSFFYNDKSQIPILGTKLVITDSKQLLLI